MAYQGKFYNDDPNASSQYTDKLGNVWNIASDGIGVWWAEPTSATSVVYGIPVSTSRHKISGSDRAIVAEGVDDAVYRWRITKGDLVPKRGGIPWWVWLVGAWYLSKRKRG